MYRSSVNILSLFLFFYLTGCAPSFSEFQTAELAGKGMIEATPYFSTTDGIMSDSDVGDQRDSIELQSSIGLRLAYGVSEKTDITFDYESITGSSLGGVMGDFSQGMGGVPTINGTGISFGLKFIAVNKEKLRLSTHFPFSIYKQKLDGGAIGEDVKTFEPTILSSISLTDHLNFNTSFKIIFPIDEDDFESNPYALNFSPSLTLPFYDQITLIPEYGILVDEGEHTHSHFGVAARYSFK